MYKSLGSDNFYFLLRDGDEISFGRVGHLQISVLRENSCLDHTEAGPDVRHVRQQLVHHHLGVSELGAGGDLYHYIGRGLRYAGLVTVGDGWEGDDGVTISQTGIDRPGLQEVEILVEAAHVAPLLLFPQSFRFSSGKIKTSESFPGSVNPNLSWVTSLSALVGLEDINGVIESSVGGLAVNRRGP